MAQSPLTPIVTKQGAAIGALTERLDQTLREVERLDSVLKSEHEATHVLDKRVVALETQILEMKRVGEEINKRAFTLYIAVVVALLAAVSSLDIALARK